MKRSAKISSSIAAAALLVGGGTAFALSQDAPESPEPVTSATVEPSAGTETVAPAPSTVPTDVPAAEPTVEPTPEATYSEAESQFLYGAHQLVPDELGVSDNDLISAGYEICEQHEAGLSNEEITVLDRLERIPHNDLNLTATNYLC